MAKTISQLVTDFQTLTNDTTTSSGTLAKTLINFGIRSVLGSQDWTFSKGQTDYSSATSVQQYHRPHNALKLNGVYYLDSNVWYALPEVRDDNKWRQLNSTVVTGLPYYWCALNETGDIELFPIPADSKGTVRIKYTKKIRDVGLSDYSTGSVTVSSGTVTSGGTTISVSLNNFVGAGTSWTTLMEGRSISVNGTNTPIDGFWFEITDVSAGSVMTVKEEIPNTISNANYTISELIPLPDGFEDLPLWYAMDRYYQSKEKNTIAREYERKYKEQLGELMTRDSRSASGLIEREYDSGGMNPNSNPWSITLS